MPTKKNKYIGLKSTVSLDSPEKFILDAIKNPHPNKNYCVRFSSPELTSICPITSQPDFGNVIIDYVPSKFIMESKSFKLFIFSFRNYGGFHEDCTMKIAKKIEKYIKPKWIRVCTFWNPRGGIPIDIFYQSGNQPQHIHIEPTNINLNKGR